MENKDKSEINLPNGQKAWIDYEDWKAMMEWRNEQKWKILPDWLKQLYKDLNDGKSEDNSIKK